MESRKVRKSWFITNRNPLYIASPNRNQFFASVAQSHVKEKSESDQITTQDENVSEIKTPSSKYEVTLYRDENEVPFTVNVSDILSLSMFSRRAVVDFGTTNFTGKTLTRFLLLVNHFDTEQSVMIQRSPPENEFTIDWITSETDSFKFQSCHPATCKRISLAPVHGQSLVKITWMPVRNYVSDGAYSFHHVIQFRVNDAYFLQAVIVGRLLPPERPSRSKFTCSKRTIANQIPSLPTWTEALLQNSSVYCSRAEVKKEVSNTLFTSANRHHVALSSFAQVTPVKNQSCGVNDSITSCLTCERPQNTDFCHSHLVEEPVNHEINVHDFLLDAGESRRRSCSQPTTGTLTRDLSVFGRFHEMKELSSSRQSINTSNKLCSEANLTTDVNFLNSTATAFISPKLVRSPALKRVDAGESRRRSCSQPTTGTLTRDLSVFGRFHEMKELSSSRQSINTSNKLCSEANLTTDVNFLNSTATAFISPKLVRSPALKRDPCVAVSTYKKNSGGNVFYSNVTSVLSEMSVFGLTQWLNGVFAPCIAANSYNGNAVGPFKDICVVGSNMYRSTVEKAIELLTSPAIIVPGERIEREVDSGKLIPVKEISFRIDKGAQRRIQDCLVVNYAPIWLHLTLDALASSSLSQSNSPATFHNVCSSVTSDTNDLPYTEDYKNTHAVCLTKKICNYLFDSFVLNKPVLPIKPTAINKKTKQSFHTAKNSTTSTKLHILSRDVLFNRHVIKRFIIFVWIIDCFKSHMLIKYDPCLFRTKSHIKSSSSLLLSFAQNFLHGESNLVRHIAYLGAQVIVNQTPLDEYQFTVENLAVDLRDGVRLVKLADLLIPTLPTPASNGKIPLEVGSNRLMSLVRFPAISRLQKIHNVGVALKSFEQYGQISMSDGSVIDPRDIVDGHREKTLTLLWCLLLRHQVLALLNHSALESEIHTLETNINSFEADSCVLELSNVKLNISSENNEKEDKNHIAHSKLLYWASLVCHLYGVPVTSLDESFTDGRALCYLLHHYLPTVLPQGLIRQCTTHTINTSISLPNSVLIRNNLFNLSLFQRKLSILGDVPLLFSTYISTPISSADLSNLLPPGLVVTTLAYLANRLVVGPSEKHKLNLLIRENAACIIQNAWRSFQEYINFSKLKLIPYGREWRNERKKIKACTTIQAFVRGYLVRKQVAQIISLRSAAATIIQANVRRFLVLCYVGRLRKSVILIQSTWRGYQARQNYSRLKKLCITLQAFSRGFLTRSYIAELQGRRNSAATIIQSHFRRLVVQRNLRKWHESAVHIQIAWRGYYVRRKYVNLKQWCISIQKYARGYLARDRLVTLQYNRNSAATVIQSHFRKFLVLRDINTWHGSARQIQSCWRSYRSRRIISQFRDIVLLILRRYRASRMIQRWWRSCFFLKFLTKQRCSAIRIQTMWRGFRIRKHLFALAEPSKKYPNSTSQTDRRGTHLASSVTSKLKSIPSYQSSKQKSRKEKCLLSLEPSEAKFLLDIYYRLNRATERARTNLNLTLAAKARNALKQLSRSTSVNQILDAIRLLEMITGLSVELCYWVVGLSPNNLLYNVCSSDHNENSSCVLICFFQIMMACNRSVPHEDIFVAITGTLLNVVRHKDLASNLNLWWSPLSLKSETGTTNGNKNDMHEELQPPAVVHLLNTRLRRHQSLPGLCSTGSDMQLILSPHSHLVKMNRVDSLESTLPQNSLSITQNMSIIDVLMEILQRTWRARPGTVSIRLFSRTCCLLALLFNSAPTHIFLHKCCLLPTLREIYEGLYRRSDPHSRFHLNFDPLGDSTNPQSVNEVRSKASNTDIKKLRANLSSDLDWHLRPIKTRPNPLIAIQYLLLITERKVTNA
ncbi:Abnormal spindle-like microcephaly-associated protein [Schistosoma japonicum]|uniref:Abnormal spindle-like microcephaly-associated protein n=1 Tax=Schistosoma japonicum TaxID=6182 RepID=A0A4Z2CSD1_SCHJA|nr:Abnormal spindle-like microcephaly-associated protein [Schistosoma japonicum]